MARQRNAENVFSHHQAATRFRHGGGHALSGFLTFFSELGQVLFRMAHAVEKFGSLCPQIYDQFAYRSHNYSLNLSHKSLPPSMNACSAASFEDCQAE